MYQVTVERPSDCLSRRSTTATTAGGFAAEQPCGQEISIDGSAGVRRAACAPALSSKCG